MCLCACHHTTTQGKDEVARIAERGGEPLATLRAAAPGLTLQQLYKLTEHHHDDWAVGAHSSCRFAPATSTVPITFTQLCKLSEHHHDDWAAGAIWLMRQSRFPMPFETVSDSAHPRRGPAWVPPHRAVLLWRPHSSADLRCIHCLHCSPPSAGMGGAGGTLPLLRALQAALEAAPAVNPAGDDDDQLLLDSQVGFRGI